MIHRLVGWLKRLNPEERRATNLVDMAEERLQKAERQVEAQRRETLHPRVNILYDAIVGPETREGAQGG